MAVSVQPCLHHLTCWQCLGLGNAKTGGELEGPHGTQEWQCLGINPNLHLNLPEGSNYMYTTWHHARTDAKKTRHPSDVVVDKREIGLGE